LRTSALLPLLLLLGGCDNPACIFSAGGCNGSTGALGDHPATVPGDSEWIETAPPTVTDAFPGSSAAADTHTPVVLVFSESMRPADAGTTPAGSLASAFELRTVANGIVPISTAALIGNGRVLVLLPQTTLTAATTYSLFLHTSAVLTDRTGQSFSPPSNRVLTTFTTVSTPAAAPKLIASFPKTSSTNQGGTTEFDVVFDRAIDPSTVDASSFDVEVAGSPPVNDPLPQPLATGSTTTDARAFTWRSVDSQGVPAPLGEGANVVLHLSPAGHEIRDTDGDALAATDVTFDIAAFSAPLTAAITSVPDDAIGIAEISGPADLAVQVELSGAQSGDFLVLTMFGVSPDVPLNPPLIALRREVALTAPFDSFTLTAAEIDLLRTASPVAGRFLDGSVSFAFQLRRGAVESPLTLLDVDATTAGVQSPILDTVAPTLLGLGLAGTSATTLRSDLRDVSIHGRASETILKAEVVTALGNNELTPGQVPPVVASDATGLFVAAPVRAGVLAAADDPLDFTLTLYDRALNSVTVSSDPGDPADGFRQLGSSGPGTPLPGGTVTVEVFDVSSLAPVAGASVWVHQVLGGTVTAVNATAVATDAAGVAVVPAAPAGTTIVTVEKTGYDLWTFQGVPTSRLGVPLGPAGLVPGSVDGTVGPIDQGSATDLNLYTRAAADSRRQETDPTFAPVQTCAPGSDPASFECPFGPIPVQPNRLGAQTAVTVLNPPDVFTYSALTFLKTAALALPLQPVLPSGVATTSIPIPFLLDAGNLDPEERPIDVPQHTLSTASWPILGSDPEITVEATVPGLAGTIAIGRGIAFDQNQPPDTWIVRAAYPGSADGSVDFPGDQLGSLVTQGTIDADLFIGVEVDDGAGNRGGSRPRFSATTLSLAPRAPPVLPPNPISTNAGNQAMDLTFPDVYPDAVSPSGKGIYRVVLTDSAGRSWTVFVPDPRNAAGPNVIVHLPDLGGVFPLASGSVDGRISGWSWPTLDLADFLWTDIPREHDLSVDSAVQTFTLP
jgi:hypothetical protein